MARTAFLSMLSIALLFFATGSKAEITAVDKAPYLNIDASGFPAKGPVAHYRPLDYLVFWTEAGVTCNDNHLLGCEFAGEHYYITGGNSGNDPNKVYMLDTNGNYFGEFDQWGQPGWGWRDLAYDGVYLYGSDSDTIYAFDLDGNPVPSMNIIGPISPCRGLAYDPETDHFWTASWGSPLYEFDRSGNIHYSGPSGLSHIYGLAWEDYPHSGPWLWMFDQSGYPPTTLFQYDPVNHMMTGYVYPVPLIPGCTDQCAGGLAFIYDISPYGPSFVGIAQATPEDMLFVDERCPPTPPEPEIIMSPLGTPIIIPASGGSFDFNVQIVNMTWIPQTFDAWIMVTLPNGTQLGPLQGPLNLFLLPGYVAERNRSQVVPAGAPAGEYAYWGYIGVYPDTIWDSDSFPFTKLDEGGGEAYLSEWQNVGESFDIYSILAPEDRTEVPSGFALMNAYPNPFNPITTISFTLTEAGRVELRIYNLAGRTVVTLLDRDLQAGSHSVQFDGSRLASGVYLAVLESGKVREVDRLLLLK